MFSQVSNQESSSVNIINCHPRQKRKKSTQSLGAFKQKAAINENNYSTCVFCLQYFYANKSIDMQRWSRTMHLLAE